ncbi:aldolase [Actinophytocola xinjiangensis]|uniref:Aldolase n=1 Tax=Actinophytocola xinjiangensis TaxID=485602 RepID=A0A7Z0WJ18_9PSEU|nr:aldolase/citrate lyase family protein [Actinophytocola xinjiangensis]OLF08431.1 aldolase [Actinophytocola xinjiangensis]
MPTSLEGPAVAALAARLVPVDAARAAHYPGDRGERQPVHTCYVPADQVVGDLAGTWGAAALAALAEHAPDPAALAALLGLPEELAESVYGKVVAKLRREPVEDLRVDFEDGYGRRPDAREDADAVRCAALVAGWRSGPPWVGLRFRPFDTPESFARGVRTLDLFVTGLGAAPVLTFPKVTDVEQVSVLVELLELLESRVGLDTGALRFEIQIETTQSIVDSEGRFAVPRLVAAGRGRVSGLHFGTYDYTAACGLSAADQHLAHPACDFARHAMQVGAAGTGVALSDGSTNILPVGDRDAVHAAWRTHYALVLRSLEHGFHQGWDLHPAQLVTRYAANFVHHLRNAPADARRLRAYLDRADTGILDEPATAQAMARSLRRALDCGALNAAEVHALCGLSEPELAAVARRENP